MNFLLTMNYIVKTITGVRPRKVAYRIAVVIILMTFGAFTPNSKTTPKVHKKSQYCDHRVHGHVSSSSLLTLDFLHFSQLRVID